MMTAICGDRGIGKTYLLADECYERYKQGYFIVTNFDFVYSNINFSSRSPDDFYKLLRQILLFKERGFDPYDLFAGFRHTGIFIAIDEGHLFFSADLWKRYQTDETFQDVLRVLAQARKLDIEIFYTTQDPAKIDVNFRRYTEDWIRFRPLLNLRKKIMIRHESKPIFRRELRHIIPLVWKEWHNLKYDAPVFDYSTIKDENGFMHLAKTSTLIKRRLRRMGSLKPFPYKLYDSNEILSVGLHKTDLADFEDLAKLVVVPYTFKRERFPTIKKILRRARNDAKYPTRYRLPYVKLGNIPQGIVKKISLLMPTETMADEIVEKSRKDAIRALAR